MYYIDAYADMYQKLQGFEICLIDKGNKIEKAYLRLANEYRVDPKLSQEENNNNEIIIKKLK